MTGPGLFILEIFPSARRREIDNSRDSDGRKYRDAKFYREESVEGSAYASFVSTSISYWYFGNTPYIYVADAYKLARARARGKRDAHERYAFSSRVVVSLPCQGQQRGTESMVCVRLSRTRGLFLRINEMRNVSRVS